MKKQEDKLSVVCNHLIINPHQNAVLIDKVNMKGTEYAPMMVDIYVCAICLENGSPKDSKDMLNNFCGVEGDSLIKQFILPN
jgi:hypothetical protein